MSRAILTMALARTFHRQPTDGELTEFLLALRDLAGDRVYVPQREPTPDKVAEITALRDAGLSIRNIAREVGVSKSQVHRALSQMSALPLDSEAA
jgi:DNA invertase Pin-like site-specific DNA recombinase